MVGIARRRIRAPRLVLLVLALGQLVSPFFLFVGNGSLQADGPGEPPVVPAGYTFAIWAVICLLGAAYAVWQLPGRGPVDRLLDDVAWPLAGVFAGFSLWLVLASTGPQWATVVVFAAMLVLLLVALRTVFRADALRADVAALGRTGRTLLLPTLGIYAGWTGVAVWVNLATALVVLGAPTTGVLGTLGQLGILAAATATACAVTAWTRGLLPLAGAAAWALVGAVIGAGAQGATLLAGAAVVGLVLLAATTVASRRRAVISGTAT